eukprot:4081630-Ditylum_brightwellii.AAC.1
MCERKEEREDSVVGKEEEEQNVQTYNVPEHEEGKEDPDIEENPFCLGRSNNNEGHHQYPVPIAPAV